MLSLAEAVKVVNKNYGHIRPDYLKPELSTKLYRTTFNYLKQFYSETLFYETCEELGMPAGYLLDDDNWVSVHLGSQFAEIIQKKTNDPEIYRKIGQYFLSPENINTFEYTLLRSLSPFLLLRSIKQFYRKSNAVCEIEVLRLGFDQIQLNIKSEIPLYKGMALNTLGIAEAFKNLYELNNFKADLTLQPGKELHGFSIQLQFLAAQYYLKRISWIIGFCTLGYFLGSIIQASDNHYGHYLTPVLAGVIALLMTLFLKLWENLRILKKGNLEYYEKTREKNMSLYQKSELLERRYQEAKLLKELSNELILTKEPLSVIKTCIESTKQKFGYSKIAIFMHSKERKKLYLSVSSGFETLAEDLNRIEFEYPNPDAKDLFFASVLERGNSALIIDVENYKSLLKPQNRGLVEMLNVGSMIVSPIQSQSEKYGLLVLIREKEDVILSPEDKFLIDSITAQLSLYFESAMNFENEFKLRKIFQKYVPRPVLESIQESKYLSQGNLQPQRTRICSVFIDLRGFTSICDGIVPEKVFELINLYASFVTKTLAQEGAIIDNIIGDEVVAFFIQKDNKLDYVSRSFKAVLNILNSIDEFQADVKSHGFPPLAFGVGIHSGEASVGTVGSDFKMNFTALGNTVNVASRLQSISKKFAAEPVTIIISEDVLKELKLKVHGLEVHEEVLRGTSELTRFYKIHHQDLFKFCHSFETELRAS